MLASSTVTAESVIMAIEDPIIQGNFSLTAGISTQKSNTPSPSTASTTGMPVGTGLRTDQIVGIVLGVVVTIILVGVLVTVLIILS